MEYSEILSLLKDPDRVAEGLTALDDYNKDISTQLQDLKQKETDSEKRIRDLQDSNMKLYLRITGTNTETEKEDKDDFERLLDKLKEKE